MKAFNLIKDESGVAVIIVAFSLTAILGFAALAIDIGQAYLTASDLQNVADAVVFSAGSYLPVKSTDIQRQTVIKNKANEYAQKNRFVNLEDEDVAFEDIENENYYSMAVELTKTIETDLAKVIGINYITITKSAKVTAMPTGAITGAVPIGISEEAFDEAKQSGNDENLVLKFGGGDGTQGFYGFLVLDGAKGNANILEKWLKYGYEGVNSVGEQIPTASGNKTSAARDGTQYRYDRCNHYVSQGGCNKDKYVSDCPRVIYILVYKFVNSQTVEIVGFAPFIIEPSVQADEIRGSYLDMNVPTKGKIGVKECGSYTIRLTK